MKTSKIFFFILIIFSASIIYSQTTDKYPSIEVYGTAQIKVVPDIINFSLSVSTENNNVLAAKNDNDRSVNKIIDLLKDRGILEKDIQTSGIRVNKNYRYDENEKVKEFSVENYITFTLKDISKYYDITTELIKIEHVSITYSNFDYSNIIETRKHARGNALIAARDKAEEMAQVLGLDMGKPILISEEQVYDYYPNPFNAVNQQGTQNYTSSYGLQEGTINVEAKVRVIFEIINR
jgi:hypothetical protein